MSSYNPFSSVSALVRGLSCTSNSCFTSVPSHTLYPSTVLWYNSAVFVLEHMAAVSSVYLLESFRISDQTKVSQTLPGKERYRWM